MGAAPSCGIGGTPAGDSAHSTPPQTPEPPPSRWRLIGEDWLGVDLRSLALFRVCMALLILADLADRAVDLSTFYTDAGVLPRTSLLSDLGWTFSWSAHMATGSTWGQAFLFALAAIFALAMLVGYRTRWAAFASWFMLISLHARNPLVIQGGDLLFRSMLFWSLFLPMGARWSVDAALDTDAGNPDKQKNSYLAIPSMAIVLQLCSMYWFSVVLKQGRGPEPSAWTEGVAVWYALHLDLYATPIAVWIRQYPWLCEWLTWMTLVMEAFGPVLVFSPIFRGPMRMLAVVLMMGMHIGFASCLAVGIFTYAAVTSWTVIIPGWFWDRVLMPRLRKPRTTGLRIFYDGNCGFCLKTARLIREFVCLPQVPLAPVQSDPAANELFKAHNSWVVIDERERAFIEWEAMSALVRGSPWLWPLAWVTRLPGVRSLGRLLYRAVADHRGWMADWTAWLSWRAMRAPGQGALHGIGSGVALMLFFYMLAWNVRSLDYSRFKKYFPEAVNYIGMTVRIDQYWSMFAPRPLSGDGWFVMPGKLVSGKEVDLFDRHYKGAPLGPRPFDKPAWGYRRFRDNRWEKYMENILNKKYEGQRLYFGRWLCRQWLARHPRREDKLLTFTIYWMLEKTNPPPVDEDDHTPPVQPPQRITLWAHECFSAAEKEKFLGIPASKPAATRSATTRPATTRPATQALPGSTRPVAE